MKINIIIRVTRLLRPNDFRKFIDERLLIAERLEKAGNEVSVKVIKEQ